MDQRQQYQRATCPGGHTRSNTVHQKVTVICKGSVLCLKKNQVKQILLTPTKLNSVLD